MVRQTIRILKSNLAAASQLDDYRRFWTDRLDILEDLLRQDDRARQPKPKGDAT